MRYETRYNFIFDTKREEIIAEANNIGLAEKIAKALNLLEESSSIEENLRHG